jgi:hypothetical protein
MWRTTKNNGITEGFHAKIEMIQRRAHGFSNFDNLRRLFLINWGGCLLSAGEIAGRLVGPYIGIALFRVLVPWWFKPPPRGDMRVGGEGWWTGPELNR